MKKIQVLLSLLENNGEYKFRVMGNMKEVTLYQELQNEGVIKMSIDKEDDTLRIIRFTKEGEFAAKYLHDNAIALAMKKAKEELPKQTNYCCQ